MNPFVLKGAQQQLVELLKEKGITDENVLSAFGKVERHRFIESFLWDKAYKDLASIASKPSRNPAPSPFSRNYWK